LQKVLKNKVAIITGANQGLGLRIAQKYLDAGANLMLCARNNALLKKSCDELRASAASGQRVEFLSADISIESESSNVVKQTLELLGGCHILVNNAGIYGPKGEIELTNWDDWVRVIEINVFGSVLMSRAVLPYLKAQKYGKIIQLSGGGATNPMPRISAYAVSKAAIVRYAETLAEEVRGTGIDVNAIAPGALNTRMLEEILQAGPNIVGQEFYDRSLAQKENGGAGFDKAVELALFLASSASDGITAKLISAIWDKWERWPEHMCELLDSDVYTLRRIAGKDRDFGWGDK
jgi:3-oxoacyl-[acyl-carrier protein] reductase